VIGSPKQIILLGNNKFSKLIFLENPLIHIDLNLNPSFGTTLPSILSLVPTITKYLPQVHFSKSVQTTATAGNKMTTVPPPANKKSVFALAITHLLNPSTGF